jgi:hypothetical protein
MVRSGEDVRSYCLCFGLTKSPLKKGTSIFSGRKNTAKMAPEKKNVPFFNGLLALRFEVGVSALIEGGEKSLDCGGKRNLLLGAVAQPDTQAAPGHHVHVQGVGDVGLGVADDRVQEPHGVPNPFNTKRLQMFRYVIRGAGQFLKQFAGRN